MSFVRIILLKSTAKTTIDDVDVADRLREPLDAVRLESDQLHPCIFVFSVLFVGCSCVDTQATSHLLEASTKAARSSSFVENSTGLCGIRLEKQESNVLVHGENKCEDLKN